MVFWVFMVTIRKIPIEYKIKYRIIQYEIVKITSITQHTLNQHSLPNFLFTQYFPSIIPPPTQYPFSIILSPMSPNSVDTINIYNVG
jgi:hypothetical protein